ncbi:hypothetical protein [Brevundimonas variabilis]|uniref:Lipoprotein n=1 Tax=Brevundimonas variabilis TaxID=74312 RepID=A0A7W9CJ74_9CAUL|nr:hypothetical protein [Brevundimonas variabilis]MBB5746551.1 hypothetical protein [Brevundimonas variabilis]
MIARLILIAGLILVSGCVHRGGSDLPTCDGSARRPANPHGSVLAPQAEPRPASPVLMPGAAGGCL